MQKNNKKIKVQDAMTEFLLYTSPSGDIKVEVFLHNENIWLTQDKIAEFFEVQRPAITKHLGNIFTDGELEENSVSSILEHTASDGKNYLQEADIKKLERTISGYFDYIERLIETRTTFTMEQLAESVNEFLQFNKYEILEGKGKISHKKAEQKAFSEYDKFNKTQKIESDFDREVKKLIK